jgi:hypothetical protein
MILFIPGKRITHRLSGLTQVNRSIWVNPNPIIQNHNPRISCCIRIEFKDRVKNYQP